MKNLRAYRPDWEGWPLLLLLVFLCMREVTDPDIWFYLVVARETLAIGQLPTQEFYIYPALGEAGHFSAWGFGILHVLADRLAGLPGMSILNGLLCGGALWLLMRAIRVAVPREISTALLLAPIAVAYAIASFRMVYRPETTLFLFMAIEILLLERWLADAKIGRLAWIPLLALIITQLHTTAILLWLIFLAYAAHWIIRSIPNTRRAGDFPWPTLAWLAASGIATAVLPILNPYGTRQLLLLVQSALGDMGGNVEFLPVMQTDYRLPFLLLAALVAVAWLVNPARRIVDAILLIAFGALAFRYARNLGLFALIAVLPLGLSLASPALSRSWKRVAGPRIVAALALVGMVVTSQQSGVWGSGVDQDAFPVVGAQRIRAVTTGGNVLNFFHLGGYLAWQLGTGYRVAMDGHFVRPTRADPYHDALFRADSGWERQLWRDQVVAVVTPSTLPHSGGRIPLVERLAESPDWQLVAVEPAGLTFVPRHLATATPSIAKSEIWRQALRELDEVVKTNPDPAQAVATRAWVMDRLALSQ